MKSALLGLGKILYCYYLGGCGVGGCPFWREKEAVDQIEFLVI